MTNASDFFRNFASRYDSFAVRAMPRYEEMIGEIVRCLPDGAANVLELGCGTGSLTALLLRRYPDARVTANDGAREMIEEARDRLNSLVAPPGRIVFIHALFEELDLPDSAYDLIASNMSLHHIAEKAPFYRRLYESLRPGGLFVLGDELMGALLHVQELNWNGWLSFARDSGGLSDVEIADVVKHEREFDHYETLARQVDLLTSAGFEAVDCVWRYLNYAVFVAQK